MNHAEHNDHRLTNLEIKVGFTDDLLDEINRTLYLQQQQIEMLTRELQTLRDQSGDRANGNTRGLRDDLPPHY